MLLAILLWLLSLILWDLIGKPHNRFSHALANLDSNQSSYEPPHGKMNNLHIYAKTKTQISLAVTAKLISAFVFAKRIVQSLFYLYPKFKASSSFLCLYRSVCVGPVRKPHCWFSHEGAHIHKACMLAFYKFFFLYTKLI